MGYSKDYRTLDGNIHLFKDLARGLETSWKVLPGTEEYWAYKIREGLYIAHIYPRRYPELALAYGRFKIEFVSTGLIQAKISKNSSTPEVVGIVSHGLDTDPRGLYTGRAPQLLGPQTAETIMKAWFDSQPSNTPLYFPDAALSRQELLHLHQLATAQQLIFFESDGAITLQPRQRKLEGLHWSPEDLEEQEEDGDPRLEDDDD